MRGAVKLNCTKSEGHMGAKAELKMKVALEATAELGLKATVEATCKTELK